MGLFRSGDGVEEHLGTPRGDYVTPKRVKKVVDVLNPDEKVHYLTKGNTLAIGKPDVNIWLMGEGEKISFRGYTRAAFTNTRVVIKIPQWVGAKDYSIPYESISSIETKSGLVFSKMGIRTHSEVYRFDIYNPGKDELREIVSFVQNKRYGGDNQVSERTEAISDTDPLHQLERLKELHEEGVISEEEFSEMKQELLDRI